MEKVNAIIANVPKPEEYAVSSETWTALKAEIEQVSRRIAGGEELVPDDVKNIKALKKQVEDYLAVFNKAMSGAQAEYRRLVMQQLDTIGYPAINQYIQTQRAKQVNLWNLKIQGKQQRLAALIKEKLDATRALKHMPIAGQLLPAFVCRFPKVNSAAKDKEITNWDVYGAFIGTTLNTLDVFYSDPAYADAALLPINSVTTRQLLAYVRDGDWSHLGDMKGCLAKDAPLLKSIKLKQEVTDKASAVSRIGDILARGLSPDETLAEIAAVLSVASQC